MKKVGKVILRVFVVVAAVAGTIAGLFFFKNKRKKRINEDIESDDDLEDEVSGEETSGKEPSGDENSVEESSDEK
ncbi:MAG: hypothetical protein K6F97_09975 [Lachnospiraceae bacterium]|nr:hypothetical protein [Lachnospiraceae bacterium]